MENDIKSQQQITKTTCSFGQKNEKTDLADYFENRTISGKQIIAEDNERKAEILRLEAKNLNSALVNHNYPEIGDLFKGDLFDIESTLKW